MGRAAGRAGLQGRQGCRAGFIFSKQVLLTASLSGQAQAVKERWRELRQKPPELDTGMGGVQ